MLTRNREVRSDEVTVGIVTALPVERRAMEELIDGLRPYRNPEDRNAYWLGTVPSIEPGHPHRVALLMMARDGTQLAATYCANMLRTFPFIQTVIMTGIAGGIPRPESLAKHVRLGDVVVAIDGIVNYTSVRQEGEATRLRQPQGSGLIANWLLQASRELQVLEERGDRLWENYLDPLRWPKAAPFTRPDDDTDVLYVRRRRTEHPLRPNPDPAKGMPRVHYGVIGSADMLMVDEDTRDQLADDHPDMRAIEMEGTGIATSTAAFDRTWFMVRGVADYCEAQGKNDVWHPYASYAAAAYVRALLEVAHPFDLGRRRSPVHVRALVDDDAQDDLDGLLRQVPPDFDLRLVWRQAVPDRWDVKAEVLNSPSAAYHSLTRLNAEPSGLHPAVLFIAAMSEHLRAHDERLAGQLGRWALSRAEATGTAEALRTRLRPRPDVEPVGVGPLLLIEITVDGIDREQCRIVAYLQGMSGPWRPRPVNGERVRLADVGQAVSRIVTLAEEAWGEGGATGQAGIEFLLPASLLNLPVQWYTASRLGLSQPICVRYQVAVRSKERMQQQGIRREWMNRWRRLDEQPFTGVVRWGVSHQTQPVTTEAWVADLSADDSYVVVVLSEPPNTDLGRQEIFAALAAGVPVILWDQRQRNPTDRHPDTATDAATNGAADGLRQLVAEPVRLPAQTRAVRVEAERMAAQVPDHFGRSVALLWDDPYRVVTTGRTES